MNRLITVLVIAVIILVGAVAYLLGQKNSGPAQSSSNVAATGPASSSTVSKTSLSKAPGVTRPSRPVMVGLNGPNLDACGSNARVVGLNANGDNFLAVKAAPLMNAPRIDKLGPGFEVYVCQESKDHNWLGVVYEPDGQPSANCGVTGPVASPRPYAGRCQSGWVYSKYVEIYAG